MKNKKAMEVEALVLLIILVTGAIILFAASGLWGQEAGEALKVDVCKLSMENAKANKGSFVELLGILQLGIDCPSIKYGYEDEEGSMEEIYTKHLRSCWSKTLGRSSPIGKYKSFFLIGKADKNSCFVCSEFTVEEDIEIKEMADFLASEIPGSDKEYIDYLDTDWTRADNRQFFVNINDHGEVKLLDNLEKTTKQSKNPYYTVFVYNKKGTKPQDYYTFLDPGWKFTPYDEQYHHVLIIPVSDYSKLECDERYWQQDE